MNRPIPGKNGAIAVLTEGSHSWSGRASKVIRRATENVWRAQTNEPILWSRQEVMSMLSSLKLYYIVAD